MLWSVKSLTFSVLLFWRFIWRSARHIRVADLWGPIWHALCSAGFIAPESAIWFVLILWSLNGFIPSAWLFRLKVLEEWTSNIFIQQCQGTVVFHSIAASDSCCSLRPLWSGMGEVVPACTSLTLHPSSPPTVLYLFCLKVSHQIFTICYVKLQRCPTHLATLFNASVNLASYGWGT